MRFGIFGAAQAESPLSSEATAGTHAKFAGYLDLWAKRERWSVRDKHATAQVFAGLLQARIFDEVLLGLHQLSDAEIARKAREAAKSMLLLLNDGRF
jgi:AefR-like transcriptional repressor, C-terminal domain